MTDLVAQLRTDLLQIFSMLFGAAFPEYNDYGQFSESEKKRFHYHCVILLLGLLVLRAGKTTADRNYDWGYGKWIEVVRDLCHALQHPVFADILTAQYGFDAKWVTCWQLSGQPMKIILDEVNAVHAACDHADSLPAGIVLGQVFESLITLDIYQSARKRVTRKALGSYYTPYPVVKYMVQASLGTLFEDILPDTGKSANTTYGQDDPQSHKHAFLECLFQYRIMDPAMGSGHFLVAAVEYVQHWILHKLAVGITSSERKQFIANCLHGYDVNPLAVILARVCLLINEASVDKRIPVMPIQKLRLADSLKLDIADEEQYDVVLGNPPYQSYGLRGLKPLSTEQRQELKRRFPAGTQYKISLYAVFMELGIRLTREGGWHGFLVPDSFLRGKYYSSIRAFMQAQAAQLRCVVFERDFWKTASVGKPVVYMLRKRHKSSKKIKAYQVEVGQAELLRQSCSLESYDVSKREFFSRHGFRMVGRPQERAFIAHIEKNGQQLDSVARFYSGLIGLKGKQSIILQAKQLDDAALEQYGELLVSGSQLRAYAIERRGHFCYLDKALYKSGYSKERFEQTKLFVNQTGATIKCAVVEKPLYCLNNMHVGLMSRPAYDPYALSCVLNSSIFQRYFQLESGEAARPNAQVDLHLLHMLTVPSIKAYSQKLDYELFMKSVQQMVIESELQHERIQQVIVALLHRVLGYKRDAPPTIGRILADLGRLCHAEFRLFRDWEHGQKHGAFGLEKFYYEFFVDAAVGQAYAFAPQKIWQQVLHEAALNRAKCALRHAKPS